MALTHVLNPIQIGGAKIKNRVVRTAHGTRIGVSTMSDDLIAYHGARAKGGVGLTVVEIMSVHPSSWGALRAWDPELIRGYEKLTAEANKYDMTLFQQLWHGGNNTAPIDGTPPWSSGDIPGPVLNVVPISMTKTMIDDVVAAFSDAARKCESLGLHGVEIHCAHGYLIQQFLSSVMNNRKDDYGGSFENRARFMMEVVAAVRASVSRDFVVGVRIAPDDMVGGTGIEENRRALELLEHAGLIDYVSVSMGNYQRFAKMIGGMHEPVGYELATSDPVLVDTKLVRMVTGRFRTLEEADQVIRAGKADMIGLTRATIADPDLVAKTMAGKAEEVRPCIACNQGCIGQIYTVGKMGCAVNPAVGFERTLSEDLFLPAESPRKVLVVGGGIAGMEAARVARLRGHNVILAEARPELGGCLTIAAMAPTRHGILDVATWLESEIYRVGVNVRLSTYMDYDDVLAEQPDFVVVATGAFPRMDGIQLSNPGEPMRGLNDRRLISSQDLFLDARDRGANAVVVDDLGHYEAIAAAEKLVNDGLQVTLVTRHTALSPAAEFAQMVAPALERLQRGKFRLMTRTRAFAIKGEGVLVGSIHGDANATNTLEMIAADTVVFVSANRPNRDLLEPLKAVGLKALAVGDANSPRYIQNCIRDGRLAGLAA